MRARALPKGLMEGGPAIDGWRMEPARSDVKAHLKAYLRDHREGLALALRIAALVLAAFTLTTLTLVSGARAQTEITVAAADRLARDLPQVGAYARLKAEVTVDGAVVTLGDLVEGAGSAASTPVFLAPEPGLVGHLDAGLVRQAALEAGLSGLEAAPGARIAVHRFGSRASAVEVEALLRGELAARLGAPSGEALEIAFAEPLAEMAMAGEAALRLGRLDVYGESFEGAVALGGQSQPVSGRVAVKVPALVLTRAIGRGEVLDAADLTFAEIVRPRHGEAVPAYEEAIGFAVTRGLKPGEPLLAGDLMRPFVMQRGEPVTLVHRRGRMVLTARGDALKDGRVGDIVDILNTQSRRIVQARVLGPNEAEALGPGSAPSRLSMRR